MPTVTVIVVNWNTRELLAECLQSVFETTAGLDVDVIVVDNGSADGSTVMVRERFPRVRLLVNQENVGFAPNSTRTLRCYHTL